MEPIEATNSYEKEVKDNPKDRIEIEIGDSKQPDFKPQFKLLRWDNEVNFSIRAEEKEGATVEEKDGVIKYITPKYEVHQYEKDAENFEFEWVLKEKPDTNILTTTIQHKGLDFFYQPPLTQEEIDEGASRPDNVIGSYAVYHSTKGGMNDVAGMEYKTGKFCHIYRPQAVDNNGDKVWCDLNITEGILTVTVPQKFLDEAVYPVKVDPTFGYTTGGATSDALASATNDESIRVGNTFASTEAGTVDSIHIYMDIASGSGDAIDITAFINLENTATDSHTQVVKVERTNLSISTTNAFYTFTAASESIIATNYILNVVGDGADVFGVGDVVRVYYDTSGTSNRYSESVTAAYTTIRNESPWTETETSDSRKYSFYATYTAQTLVKSNMFLIF